MKVSELSWLCHNGYGEYALYAAEHYVMAMENGDISPDKALFCDFFNTLNKDASLLENSEFKAVFEVVVAFVYSVVADADDFEVLGECPVGINADDAERLAKKRPDMALLDRLARELGFYEREHNCWLNEGHESYHYDLRDFIDFGKANLRR